MTFIVCFIVCLVESKNWIFENGSVYCRVSHLYEIKKTVLYICLGKGIYLGESVLSLEFC